MGLFAFLGAFGCSGAKGVVYRPDANATSVACTVVEVTEVDLGTPVSPSMVRPDSFFVGRVADEGTAKQALLRIDFESLTNLRPTVGERLLVHLNQGGDAVKIEPATEGSECNGKQAP